MREGSSGEGEGEGGVGLPAPKGTEKRDLLKMAKKGEGHFRFGRV